MPDLSACALARVSHSGYVRQPSCDTTICRRVPVRAYPEVSNLQRFPRLSNWSNWVPIPRKVQAAAMILRLFPNKRQEGTIRSLYGAIVAQARQPRFYREYGVPDTVNGRFDMIVLASCAGARGTEALGDPARTLGQDMFDLFCSEMDGFSQGRHQRSEISKGNVLRWARPSTVGVVLSRALAESGNGH